MKLKTWEEIKPVIRDLKKEDRRIVFTNGCFDLLHPGHVKFLEEARELGDVLIIGLNSDESVRRLKGNNRPLLNQKERCLVLSALNSVDYIVIFEDDTPYNLIKHIKPDILVKGGDWQVSGIIGGDIVQAYGGKVKSLKYLPGYSTTSLIEKIKRSSDGSA